MAEVTSRISTNEQALFYLKQAWYLTRILDKTSPSFGPEAMEYREQITELETVIKKQVAIKRESLREASIPPATPIRNSGQIDFVISTPKSAPQRTLSNNFERPVPVLRLAPSMKNSSKVIKGPNRKSISFVEPI